MPTNYVYALLARKFPELQGKLRKARRTETDQEFLRNIFNASVLIGGGIFLFVASILFSFGQPIGFALIVAVASSIIGFFYLMKLPDMLIMRMNKEIDREVVYAGKFLIVEINAGVTLYDALKTVAKNYPAIGEYLRTLINEVDLGTSIDEALNNAINTTTSKHFRQILWQILNAQQTGADVAQSLASVLDQIQRSQLIEAERYGKKLNPVAMFYLMMAVVIPSLGMVMAIIVASFMSIHISFLTLMLILGFFMFFQFMFVAIIKSMRPAIQL